MKEKDIQQDEIKSKEKNKKKEPKEKQQITGRTIIINVVVAVIIMTFVLTGGSVLGINKFFKDIGKTKIKNEDGSISIPADAQVAQNRENPNTYVGRVLNEKIRLNQQDEFNYNLMRVFNIPNKNPFEKYQLARYFFDQAINKIIGMHNARKMNITVSKDYLIREVGKRYYVDDEGDINYYAMKKAPSKVNKLAEDIMQDLLYENYIHDYFEGIPVAYDEMWFNYKMENIKVSFNYVELNNNEVNNTTLKKYYDSNKERYKQYKLIRLVFKDAKNAEEYLPGLVENPSEFVETGNKLKEEEKIVNIVYDSDFTFANDYEDFELVGPVKETPVNQVYDGVVETSVGPIILLVDKTVYGNFYDAEVYKKIKNEYISSNFADIEKTNKELARKIYDYAKRNGLKESASRYNKKLKSTPSPVEFMSYNVPNIDPDNTDDKSFIVSLFKGKKGNVIEPHNYSNGYMIAQISNKTKASKEDFEDLFFELIGKNSDRKKAYLTEDYYNKEKNKYEVIDNFNYIFNPQVFMPQTEQ